MLHEKINKKNLLELFSDIIKHENKKYGLNLQFIHLSLKDRVKEVLKENKISIKRSSDWIKAIDIYAYARDTVAFYNSDFDNISLITDKRICLISDEKFNKAEMIETAYHEFFHALDKDRVDNFFYNDCRLNEIDFGYFFSIVEELVWSTSVVKNRYVTHPTDFICEIQADLYGIERTISNHKLNKTDINSLRRFKRGLKDKYENYDTDFFLDILYRYYKNNTRVEVFKNEIFTVFYKSGEYRDINEIINDSRLSIIDNRITNSIITSSSFLEYLYDNSQNLNKSTIMYLIKLLESEIVRLNNKLDSKKKLESFDGIEYYKKRLGRYIGKTYRIAKEIPFLGKYIINPIFRNKDEFKRRYANSITDRDEIKLNLVEKVYNKIINSYYVLHSIENENKLL